MLLLPMIRHEVRVRALAVGAKRVFKLYEYIWYDHFSESGWKSDGAVKVARPYLVYSVGYLVDEDDHYLYFSDGLVPSTGQFRGTMAVLKQALKSKKVLRKDVFQ